MKNLCDFFLANMLISHVLIGFKMTRSPSMLIKGAKLCQKEVLCTASIGVQYCGDMVARGPPKHQSNWNFLAFSEPAHQMELKNASGAMKCAHSCNLGHPSVAEMCNQPFSSWSPPSASRIRYCCR